MKYKITARIQNGRNTIGYELKSTTGGTLRISKDKVLKLAQRGLLTNATYNKSTNSLSKTHTDLRKLPVIKASQQDIINFAYPLKPSIDRKSMEEMFRNCEILDPIIVEQIFKNNK